MAYFIWVKFTGKSHIQSKLFVEHVVINEIQRFIGMDYRDLP